MMDTTDARKVIDELQTGTFICFENIIELDNGYVIAKKDFYDKLIEESKRILCCTTALSNEG